MGFFVAAQAHAADTLRPQVGKPLQAAQADLQAKHYKEALVKVDEAGKVDKLTPYESYIVERMRAAAATGAGQTSTALKAYEKVVESPQMPAADKLKTYDIIARVAYAGRDYGTAAKYIAQYRDAGGTSSQTLDLLPQAMYLSGDLSGAQHALKGEVASAEKAGQKPTKMQLQLLTSIAVKQKNDTAYRQSLEQLVKYYPTPDYWQDLIARTAGAPGFSSQLDLDLYRLRMQTGTMTKASEFMEAAQLALQAGYPGEAQQYVDLGYKDKLLGVGSDAARHQRLKDMVARKIAEDKKSMAEGDKLAAQQAGGDALVSAGLNHVGYGDYQQGIALIEQGIAKGGLKKPAEAQLHLGYAQMLAGKDSAASKTLAGVKSQDGAGDVAHLMALTI
ncbi:hypothetical protein G7Y82_20780 [Solimonas sp. C16B3]|uniref:Tetratricopeptide repeat protein n=2 Tax=Solimonas marina TaxID=2714601 RepID=A0A969WDV3_9GAMM|nr:hypothetical protein [Solimonas marina]